MISDFLCLPTVLDATAGLLSLDPFHLGDALTQKYMVLRGEEITTPLTVQQVSGRGLIHLHVDEYHSVDTCHNATISTQDCLGYMYISL